MVCDPTRIQRMTLAICLVLAAALLLRIVNLDADPSAFTSRDFITDEGWWAHNARNAFFYGEWRIDEHNLGLYSASFYNLLLYLTFKLFGISFATLRMPSALFGWSTVLMISLLVRREISQRAALLATVFLGFCNLHIIYSRTGFTEGVMVFFLALTFWLWSLRRSHGFFALVAGVSAGLMVVTKITAVYLIPGFILAAGAAAIQRSVSRRDGLLFLVGVSLVGAICGALLVVTNFGAWLRFNVQNGADTEWATIPFSLVDSIPRLLASPFYAEAPLFTALSALSLCLFAVGVSRDGLTTAIRRAGELELASAMLLIGYLCVLSIVRYQPERRFIPALFLMVVLSAGVLEKGWASLEELAKRDSRIGAIGWFVVLFALPTIGVLEAKGRTFGAAPSTSLWLTKLMIIGGLIALAVASSRGALPDRFWKWLLVASRLLFVLLFFILSLGLIYKSLLFWGLAPDAWRAIDRRVLMAGSAAVVACGVVLSRAIRDARRAAPFLLSAFLLIEGLQISTWLLQPTYTLSEASESLAKSLTLDKTIVTYYETVLIPSGARVICRSTRRGFNVDAFETARPQYIAVLRRDNWRDYTLEEMPPEEWPPPAEFVPTRVAEYDLCPVRLRGPRFIVELYGLSPRVNHQKSSASADE